MQTKLADFIRDTPEGVEADAILRSCVHCGFCTATCPTYQLLGDELDGPRGRIYLIKQVLEGAPATVKTQVHLDRCLTCRSCETTCPSGVKYGRLIDIGRAVVERQVGRPLGQRLLRTAIRTTLPRRWLFTPLLKTGQSLRALLPDALRAKVPARQTFRQAARPSHARSMLVLQGCVQPAMAPSINAAATRVLDALGVSLVAAPKAGCCGALRHHLNEQELALDDIRRNIDAWWPHIEQGAEAIVMTASGCGVMVKDYGLLLAHDSVYAAKAEKVSALTCDLSEVLDTFSAELAVRLEGKSGAGVAYHPPCTLQHGQQIRGKVEKLLKLAGIEASLCADSHLCCGSAGTFSILQPTLSTQLRDNKLVALQATGASCIVSANIGCQAHLQGGTATPVRHWIELIDEALAADPGRADDVS
ncbi:MAG: glycolate oxidase subunit GlcF [Pseudomonadota bacterium]